MKIYILKMIIWNVIEVFDDNNKEVKGILWIF